MRNYLIEPASALKLRAKIYGVRYPRAALEAIAAAGMEYGGWLAAHRVPEEFARARVTVHVPRGPYARSLPGIPTIRMFEAMACGIPIVSAPWDDVEDIFPAGTYLRASSGEETANALNLLLRDRDFAADMADAAFRLVRERHTCRHRADELIRIADGIHNSRHSPVRPLCEEPAS